MKISSFFWILMILAIIQFSCDNEKEEVEPTYKLYPDGSSDKDLEDYGLLNSDVNYSFPFRAFNKDRTLIFFNGSLGNCLNIKCFEISPKKELFSWTEPEPLESTIKIDLGYGEQEILEINKHRVIDPLYINDVCVFILDGVTTVNDFWHSNIYIVTGLKYYKEKAIDNQRFEGVKQWYQGGYIVSKRFEENGESYFSYLCFSGNGEKIFESMPSVFRIHNNSKAIVVPVSYVEYIEYDGIQSFYRINIEKNKVLWENTKNSLSDLPSTMRIDDINVFLEDDYVKYLITFTLYSGESGTKEIKLDLKTGSELI